MQKRVSRERCIINVCLESNNLTKKMPIKSNTDFINQEFNQMVYWICSKFIFTTNTYLISLLMSVGGERGRFLVTVQCAMTTFSSALFVEHRFLTQRVTECAWILDIFIAAKGSYSTKFFDPVCFSFLSYRLFIPGLSQWLSIFFSTWTFMWVKQLSGWRKCLLSRLWPSLKILVPLQLSCRIKGTHSFHLSLALYFFQQFPSEACLRCLRFTTYLVRPVLVLLRWLPSPIQSHGDQTFPQGHKVNGHLIHFKNCFYLINYLR